MTRTHRTVPVRASEGPRSRIARLALLAAVVGVGLARPPASAAGDGPPTTISSGACTLPPTIDGVLERDEWKEATVVKFDMAMVRMKPAATRGKRPCELRIMNSGNALYVLLRVPQPAVHKSIDPLEIDVATLAICQGRDVARGDDRKLIALGVYVDKHVTEPGKDEDDARQDGRGAAGWEKGKYTFEWALPLDAKDPEDLHVRPGEAFAFNVAYIDGFRADSKDTEVGGVYGIDFDHATTWGSVRIAGGAPDDGGVAFRGPAWIAEALRGPDITPANRMQVVTSSVVTGSSQRIGKADVAYTYRDPDTLETPAKGKIYVPESVRKGGKLPLVYSAGYELDDLSAAGWVERGYAVATPAAVDRIPLARTQNADVALLHIVRALPFVDDARVVIVGASAGGWMALMLAAETFPLAGVAPDVAPVNWGYNAAYLLHQKDGLWAKVAPLFAIRPFIEPCLKVYGEDENHPTWYLHSPLAHLSTITCPVSAVWTTADMLVPIDQIGERWVHPFAPSDYPTGMTMEPSKLMTSEEGRRRLTDVLAESEYEVAVLQMPNGAVRKSVSQANETRKTLELPVSGGRRWSIAILDEGAPEPWMDHQKYNLRWTRDGFLKKHVTGRIAADQLTAAKLDRLMDRYADREWLPTALKHLDQQPSERADVLRGLSTYVAGSADNARRFADLYGKLPPERQVLPADVVARLSAAK